MSPHRDQREALWSMALLIVLFMLALLTSACSSPAEGNVTVMSQEERAEKIQAIHDRIVSANGYAPSSKTFAPSAKICPACPRPRPCPVTAPPPPQALPPPAPVCASPVEEDEGDYELIDGDSLIAVYDSIVAAKDSIIADLRAQLRRPPMDFRFSGLGVRFHDGFSTSNGGTVAKQVNKVILLGNLGADPEIRTTTNGTRVAQLSLATGRKWRNAAGETQEKTEWHRVICWNSPKGPKFADMLEQYAKKGDRVYIEGRIEYREFTDRDQVKRMATEIAASEIVMLGKPDQRAAPAAGRAADAQESGRAYREPDDDMPF